MPREFIRYRRNRMNAYLYSLTGRIMLLDGGTWET